ncbi:TRASH domain-containing protein [Candidatus Amoebophilus asiaticus]|nr:TRASH domain-containing protein [Candidatus Amoebophilus asiaticus]
MMKTFILTTIFAGTFLLQGCTCVDQTGDACSSDNDKVAETVDTKWTSVCKMACSYKGTYDEEDLTAQPGAKTGDLAKCSVSGVVFKVSDKSGKVTYNNKDYYMCCAGCAKAFEKNPGQFLKS